jgi:hypothetical protein
MEGARTEVVVFFEQPVAVEDHYGCRFEISCLEHLQSYSFTIYGQDSLQALQLALFNAGALLPTLEGTSDWRWYGESNLGFPPKAM